MRTNASARAPHLRAGAASSLARGAPGAMAAGFLVSLAVAAVALIIFGSGENGTAQALRVTARWCFLLFWPAYAGGALAKFCGSRFAVFARHGREFGLAFAAALLVHVALVVRIIAIAADQRSPMLLFWAGVLCTYALALGSLPRLRDALGKRLWRLAMEIVLQYIAFVFAVDFIVEPLRANGPDQYPLTYLPFTIALLGGAALRLAGHLRRRPAANKITTTQLN